MPPYKSTVTETQVLRCAAEISETSSDALPDAIKTSEAEAQKDTARRSRYLLYAN
jgi:hypothetical protein